MGKGLSSEPPHHRPPAQGGETLMASKAVSHPGGGAEPSVSLPGPYWG